MTGVVDLTACDPRVTAAPSTTRTSSLERKVSSGGQEDGSRRSSGSFSLLRSSLNQSRVSPTVDPIARPVVDMDSNSIITQVQRPSDESGGESPSSITFVPDVSTTGGGSTSANNNLNPSPSPTPSQQQQQSGHNNNHGKNSSSSKSRHKSFLDTMERLLCCFRPKSRSPGDGVTSGGSLNGSSVNSDQEDYFLTPKLQGKCLLPALKASDPCLNQMCLVIDLDETLVHSSFKPIANPDFIVPVEIDGTIHQVYVLKRPFVDEFLQKVGQLYECVLFTASLAKYADPVADLLDKWGVFRSRLFRESCVFYRGNYVKDLGRLGRDLHKVVIVDNSPASYIFHPDNAVPVASWFDNVHDTELRDLIPFFEKLSKVENIYTVLRNANHVTPSHSPVVPPAHLNTTTTASNDRTSDSRNSYNGNTPTPGQSAVGAVFTNHNTSANNTPTPSRSSDHLMLQQQQQQQQQPGLHPQSYALQQMKPQVEAPATPGSVIHSATVVPASLLSSNLSPHTTSNPLSGVPHHITS